MDNEETKYNKLIGKIGDEYYFLDHTFNHADNFKGAVGSTMQPLTEEEYNERVDNYFDVDNIREFWQQAVEADKTDMGLDEWIEFVRNTDGEENVIDRSYPNYGEQLKKLLGEEVFEVECTGGGRCFEKKMKWDKLFDEKLWEEIKKFES